MKLFKRIIVALVLLTCVSLIVGGIAYWRLKVDPEWYQPRMLSAETSRAAANRAQDKVADAVNWAAGARADETRQKLAAQKGGTAPAERSPKVKTLSFTEDELNAFFDRWSAFYDWKDHYEGYLSDPAIILQDGRLIFAARMKEFPSVVSMHFEPRIEPDGKLNIKLVRVLGGKLPLPHGILDTPLDRLEGGVRKALPERQRTAKIDQTGAGNTGAVEAASMRMLLDTLEHKPTNPVLFLPIAGGDSVPIRITSVSVADKTLTMTVQMLDPTERTDLLADLRKPLSRNAIALGQQ